MHGGSSDVVRNPPGLRGSWARDADDLHGPVRDGAVHPSLQQPGRSGGAPAHRPRQRGYSPAIRRERAGDHDHPRPRRRGGLPGHHHHGCRDPQSRIGGCAVSGVQELLTQWLTSLGALLPFGFAFGAGILAAVNPCGFAMLPAYLSLYLGSQEEGFEKHSAAGRASRAASIGGVVSLGFVLLFGLAGVIVAAGGSAILGSMPWVGAVIGGFLMLMGLWMLAGRTLYTGVFERLAARVGDPTAMGVRGFFLFG